jgi:TolA-binding protein
LQSQQRHRLKEDRFATATAGAVHWSTEHRKTLVLVVSLLILGLVGYIAYTSFVTVEDQKASLGLGKAMRTYEAPIRSAEEPVVPNQKSFTSIAERAKAAHGEFLKVANDYSMTKNGKFARYMAGVAAIHMGDSAMAESLLKESANYSKDIAALSKFALANLYQKQGKTDDAARMFREVAEADAATVPKVTAQLELASLYEAKQPDQAIKVYEEIIRQEQESKKAKAGTGTIPPGQEASKTQLEQLASTKIDALKKKAL